MDTPNTHKRKPPAYKKPSAAELRRRDLAQIHIALKQLGISDDDHRALLAAVCGVHSAAELDGKGRDQYLQHLKKIGFKVQHKQASNPTAPRKSSRALAPDDQSRKIRALWLQLHALGVVQDASEAALGAYCKRITRIDALQWINTYQASALIETLKKWAMRYLPQAVQALAARVLPALASGELALPAQQALDLHLCANRTGAFDAALDAWTKLNDAALQLTQAAEQPTDHSTPHTA